MNTSLPRRLLRLVTRYSPRGKERVTSLKRLFGRHRYAMSEKYPGGGGGYSKKFYTGRLRPEVQPLTLLYTIFSEKEPLSYTFYWKKVPLSYTF